MEAEEWLTGWRQIGKYIGKSARTARRYAREGMPFYRDPAGRPIAKPSLIDSYILELNRGDFNDGKRPWDDLGIRNALSYEDEDRKKQKDFDERYLLAQKPTRGLY